MTLDCWSVSTDIHGAPSVLLMVLISSIIKSEVQLLHVSEDTTEHRRTEIYLFERIDLLQGIS